MMGDDREFISLLARHQAVVHKVCCLYMDNAHDREDLFQEVVLQAWKSFGSFRGDAQFPTWLYRVALNTAITYFKKERREEKVLTQLQPESYCEISYREDEQMQAMYKAIASLSKVDKALVALYLEDYDYKTIGEMMGISANNVAVKMNRIKAKLKEESKKYV